MIALIGASFLLSLLTGFLLTSLLFPPVNRNTAGLLLRLFAGGGLGIGVTSCTFFVCLLTGLSRYVAPIDLAVCLLLGLIAWLRRRRTNLVKQEGLPEKAKPGSLLQRLIAVLFAVESLAFVTSFAVTHLKEPHGRWDAWLIWNMHARFLFRGGEHWRDAFASGLDWSHWDYPLLLPLTIARGWRYAGGEELLSPAAMGFVFTLLILGLMAGALSVMRGQAQGCLAAMVLMGTPFFLTMGAAQFADIPFAFFVLTTVVMLFSRGRSPEYQAGPLILAGIAAGLSAWTKNEGLLFALIAFLSLAAMRTHPGGWRGSFKGAGWFLAGALPVLLIVATFKIRLSPTNDLMAGVSLAALAAKLLDWGRYAEIAKAFFVTGLSFTQGVIDIRVGMKVNPGAVSILLMAAYLLLTGVRIDRKERDCFFQTTAILVLMLAGYFFVYVVTPLDLYWHLVTSLNRLFLQLWPSAVFVVFMAAGIPGETSPAAVKPEAESLKAKRAPVKRKSSRKSKEKK